MFIRTQGLHDYTIDKQIYWSHFIDGINGIVNATREIFRLRSVLSFYEFHCKKVQEDFF